MKLQLGRSAFAFLVIFSILLTGAVQEGLVVTQPENMTAEVGKSVTINCSFTSESPSYSVTWSIGCIITQNLQYNPCYQRRVNISFQDAVQTPHKSKEPTYEGKTTITINNLTENDSGKFCCHINSVSKTGTGTGTRLEVTRKSCFSGREHQAPLKMYIFSAVIGAEACVIVILIAVVIRNHSRGLSRSKDQNPQLDPSGLQYAEIAKKSFHKRSRPRVEVDAVTYCAVKVNREEHSTNLDCELY
ncbi:immunoglobulin superfamily member 6-like [Ranitomeya imitator]|uniref:immunoglobulin superfamily member 6-like n=1 Tax=Ranitomeya imitator TaxID=111125 RepID=UPI0037E8F884